MQLKRLRRTAAIRAGQPDALHDCQEISASQLLQDLEDLVTGLHPAPSVDAEAAQRTDTGVALATPVNYITPATGTLRGGNSSHDPSSSAKRQKRQFVSLFDEQEHGAVQQHTDMGVGSMQHEQDDADVVDLVTPPWLQQVTPMARAVSRQEQHTKAAAAASVADTTTRVPMDGVAALDSAQDGSGWRLCKGAARTAAISQQQAHADVTAATTSSGPQQQEHRHGDPFTAKCGQQQQLRLHDSGKCKAAGAQRPQQQRMQHYEHIEEEDAIYDDSDDGDEKFMSTADATTTAVQKQQPLGISMQLPGVILSSPRSERKPPVRLPQQSRRSLPAAMHAPAVLHLTPLKMQGDGLQSSADLQQWQQQHYMQQQQPQQQCRGTHPILDVTNYQSNLHPQLDTAAVGHNGFRSSTAMHEDDQDAAMWEPPKNRRPQQQMPATVSRPPVPRMQQANTAGYGTNTALAGPASISGYGSAAGTAGGLGWSAPAAAVVDGNPNTDDAHPWWAVLEDFVPVEVLVQSLVNPRDNTIVHINYKSQFKEGGAAGGRAGTAGTTVSRSRKKGTGSTRGRKGAAAKAAAGTAFTTAGANFLASLQGGRKGSRKGSGSGSRKGSRKSGSGRSRGRGSGGGSGGQKKKGRRRTGRWTFINGQKVFIDHAGKQLTGSAAYMQWKASKG